ncbi:uncharacterized protein LOC124256960 [Haliotis rubra]|uniref:uncharacterized protein LOC124256960 n=1 Tax=Haliotis rubra TaxID=36100 RepID=UPI001EE52572|nr:uncharacterized protein LOC124256960 [Haliotis rubra]
MLSRAHGRWNLKKRCDGPLALLLSTGIRAWCLFSAHPTSPLSITPLHHEQVPEEKIMRLLLVFLLLPLVMMPDTEGFLSRRRRRIWDSIKCVIVRCAGKVNGRDVRDLDENNDGEIDQSEAEKVIGARFAEEVLSHAKEHGNSKVTFEEFNRSLRSLMADADAKTEDKEEEDGE